MNYEDLINAVFPRNPLWDRKDKNYHNRVLVEMLWDEIAQEMKQSKEFVKKRWKNLRDQFRIELKKMPVRRSDDTEDSDESCSSWVHFKDLMFLKDQMKCRQLPGNFEVQSFPEGQVINNEDLISSVYTRTSLWDRKNKCYHNRALVEMLWEDISQEMKQPKEDLKKRWKNLRDQFRHELKKIPIRNSGDAEDSDESYSNWAHFKDLMFLKDQMKNRPFSGKVEAQENTEIVSPPPTKKVKQEDLVSLACDYLATHNDNDYLSNLVKTWTGKLTRLPTQQRILAEKAINDVLFEAEMGTLRRDSVQINVNDQQGFFAPSL